MNSGKLRHRVLIEHFTESTSDYGDVVKSWEEFKWSWAEVVPLSGRELWTAQQVAAETTHRIRVRHITGLNTTMRVVWRGRVFEILSVLNKDERRIENELMVVERP